MFEHWNMTVYNKIYSYYKFLEANARWSYNKYNECLNNYYAYDENSYEGRNAKYSLRHAGPDAGRHLSKYHESGYYMLEADKIYYDGPYTEAKEVALIAILHSMVGHIEGLDLNKKSYYPEGLTYNE